MELELALIFMLHYYSFALFFYMLFKHTPLDLDLYKDGEKLNNPFSKKLFIISVCICWIVAIPLIFLQTIERQQSGKK